MSVTDTEELYRKYPPPPEYRRQLIERCFQLPEEVKRTTPLAIGCILIRYPELYQYWMQVHDVEVFLRTHLKILKE